LEFVDRLLLARRWHCGHTSITRERSSSTRGFARNARHQELLVSTRHQFDVSNKEYALVAHLANRAAEHLLVDAIQEIEFDEVLRREITNDGARDECGSTSRGAMEKHMVERAIARKGVLHESLENARHAHRACEVEQGRCGEDIRPEIGNGAQLRRFSALRRLLVSRTCSA
jgi:hypothetical protein